MKLKISLILLVCGSFVFAENPRVKSVRHLKDVLAGVVPERDVSIWESFPVKSDSVNIQVLDKISGKVFRAKLGLSQPIKFGTITMSLRESFVNSPDDMAEVYAHVNIEEKGNVIFDNWLFASSPSVNLFAHPVYDVRVEF